MLTPLYLIRRAGPDSTAIIKLDWVQLEKDKVVMYIFYDIIEEILESTAWTHIAPNGSTVVTVSKNFATNWLKQSGTSFNGQTKHIMDIDTATGIYIKYGVPHYSKSIPFDTLEELMKQ